MRGAGSHLVGTAHTTSRIEALTDGVFAIVMTLMVFDIRVPDDWTGSLGGAVASLWPKFFAYAVSFVQLGIYWAGHRSQFSFIQREDHTLRWISLAFLALVSLIPFSAELLGSHVRDPLAIIIYAGNLVAIGLLLTAHWAYATRRRRLVASDLVPEVISTGIRRTLTAPILYVCAIATATVAPLVAVGLLAMVPVAYLFPSVIDRIWGVRR